MPSFENAMEKADGEEHLTDFGLIRQVLRRNAPAILFAARNSGFNPETSLSPRNPVS